MMTRGQKLLEMYIAEAEQRADAGGHDLGPWQQMTVLSLFSLTATCTRCGKSAFVSDTAIYIAFARECPGA